MLRIPGLLQARLEDLLRLVTGAAGTALRAVYGCGVLGVNLVEVPEQALRAVLGHLKALPCLVKGPDAALMGVQG